MEKKPLEKLAMRRHPSLLDEHRKIGYNLPKKVNTNDVPN
jgi:hypothetical protein